MPSTPASTLQAEFLQLAPAQGQALSDELAQGLQQPQPAIAPKFLYDALGSKLFEAITELEEYYPTRTEAAIFERHRDALAQACGTGHTLVDLGAGNCAKAASLFGALRPGRYVAVDISVDFLRHALHELQARHPRLPMLGLGLDFSRALPLPPQVGNGPRLMFYPGSSIGNFAPDTAVEFLRRVRDAAPGGGLLIGVDLLKPAHVLQRAYDDGLGVTAAFNLNLLRRINRELDANFSLDAFRHEARFNADEQRIEMHLVSLYTQRVTVRGQAFMFAMGESIHTENSYKHSLPRFQQLAAQAGWTHRQRWVDAQSRFAIHVLARDVNKT